MGYENKQEHTAAEIVPVDSQCDGCTWNWKNFWGEKLNPYQEESIKIKTKLAHCYMFRKRMDDCGQRLLVDREIGMHSAGKTTYKDER